MIRTGIRRDNGHVSLQDHLCAQEMDGSMSPLCGAEAGQPNASVSGTVCARCAALDKAPRSKRSETPEKQRRADARIAVAEAFKDRKPPEPDDSQAPLF